MTGIDRPNWIVTPRRTRVCDYVSCNGGAKADIRTHSTNVRFWGKSGHDADDPGGPDQSRVIANPNAMLHNAPIREH